MRTLGAIPETRAQVRAWQAAGEAVAFVPTMGNLHEGHMALVREARRAAPRVVVSVFVNPTQFGPTEDFNRYPRTLDEDSRRLVAVGCDLLFAPPVDAMYPTGVSETVVHVAGVSEPLCGRFRPGHFDGVATVVCKLFQIVPADVALFGQKDFQQLTVIRRMVTDLNLPIRIVGVPTVREPSGLAMSSRNGFLTDAQRESAVAIYRSLTQAKAAILEGRRDFAAVADEAHLVVEAAGLVVEYLEVRNADSLVEAAASDAAVVIAVAARCGATRLIDNVSFSLPDAAAGS